MVAITSPSTTDATRFRDVLSRVPTSVVVVTGVGDDGPAGLVVGSFLSMSLEPPLVAFGVDRNSTSWPLIAPTGVFAVNVLGTAQQDLCARFAARGGDKFAGLPWRSGRSGAPHLEGCVAWIDCELGRVADFGDHQLVVGQVQELHADARRRPLVFCDRTLGGFSAPAPARRSA